MNSPLWRGIKKAIIGDTLENSQWVHQKLNNVRALAVFSSDSLSSVAYSTEEILLVLQVVAAAYLTNIAIALTLLLLILTTSYRQTIHAYPNGGGSYIVAKDNLGILPGLTAASALLVDYVLTVAVSIASGIANIASLYPVLQPYRIELCLASIAFIMLMNLRGIKESGTAFSIPTYAFLTSSFVMLAVGLVRLFTGHLNPVPYVTPDFRGMPIVNDVTLFLLVRAFSAGCLALTGVEAISNGVPAFKAPEPRNASITMAMAGGLLALNILGNAILVKHLHIFPTAHETVMSQTAAAVFGRGSILHVFHQWTTMLILILAANTSFADFPRLASLLSKDRFLPRAMASKGDRLVFQNGIIMLAALAGLLIIVFRGETSALAPLYAVGVFVSFTLSQTGMVKHWVTRKQWSKTIVNGLGAITTAVVSIMLIITKFEEGAWIVVLVVPIIIVGLLKIHHHYELVRLNLRVGEHKPISRRLCKYIAVLTIGNTTSIAKKALEDLVGFLSRSVIIKAVHINIHDENDPRKFEKKSEFNAWVEEVNAERSAEGYEPIILDIVDSPKRSILEPLTDYINDLQRQYPDYEIKLFIPEFVPKDWFSKVALHGHMGRVIYDYFKSREYQVSSIPKRIE